MSEEAEKKEGFLGQIKNQILTTVGLIITAGGGLVVTNMEAIFGVNEQPPQEITTEVTPKEFKKDTIVVLQKEQPKVIVKKVKPKPKPTPTEKRKKEFDW